MALKFKYKGRDDSAQENSMAKSSGGESLFLPNFKQYIPGAGNNHIRILPPTWRGAPPTWDADTDPLNFGFQCFVHYGIGPNNHKFWSLTKMKGGEDPINEMFLRLKDAGNDDAAKGLSWSRYLLCAIIDRNNEKEGPQAWLMPITKIYDNIMEVSRDPRTGKSRAALLDHPDEGFDIFFKCSRPQGGFPQYSGVRVEDQSTPLHENEQQAQAWLDFLEENPLNTWLKYASPEKIRAVLHAGESDTDEDVINAEPASPPVTRTPARGAAARESAGSKLAAFSDNGGDEPADLEPPEEEEASEEEEARAAAPAARRRRVVAPPPPASAPSSNGTGKGAAAVDPERLKKRPGWRASGGNAAS